jgi:hypothetical protein
VTKILQIAIMGVLICLSVSAIAQGSGVTMVVESVERTPRPGDLVVLDVKVTNSSKDVVVFKESQSRGWSALLFKTGDAKKVDLLASKRQKALDELSASKSETSEDMGATLEVAPGKNHVFRVPIQTDGLNLQSISYTVIIRRYDMKSKVDIVSSPFVVVLAQTP